MQFLEFYDAKPFICQNRRVKVKAQSKIPHITCL